MGLNDKITGQDKIVEDTLKAMKKVSVELDGQKTKVSALSALYDDIDEIQEDILASMLEQSKYRNKLLKA